MSYQDEKTGKCPKTPPAFLQAKSRQGGSNVEERLDEAVVLAAVCLGETFSRYEITAAASDLWGPENQPSWASFDEAVDRCISSGALRRTRGGLLRTGLAYASGGRQGRR